MRHRVFSTPKAKKIVVSDVDEVKPVKSVELTRVRSEPAKKATWPSGFVVIDFTNPEFASVPLDHLTERLAVYSAQKKDGHSSPAAARIERFRNRCVMAGQTHFNVQHLIEAFAAFSAENAHRFSLAYVLHSFVRRYRHKARKVFSKGDMGKKTVSMLREYYLMVQHFNSGVIVRDVDGAYSAIDFATIDAFCKAMPSNKTQHDMRMEWITTSRIHLR